MSAAAFFLAHKACAVTAFEAPPGGWSGHTFGFSYTGEYFTSNSNYNYSRGSYTSLINGNTWTSYESHLRARYNLNASISIYGGSGFSSVRAVDNGVNKTNTEATDLFLGLDWALTKRTFHLIPELQLGYPMDPVSSTQTNPLTSDGTAYVQGGVFAYVPTRHFRFGGFAGAHAPLANLAARFLYEVTVDMRVFSFVTVGAGIDGYETLISDPSNYATRLATDISANAGSERFYSYNPAMVEARAWVGFRPNSSWWIRLGYGQTINGTDAAQGQSILLSLAFNTPTTGDHLSRVDATQAVKEFQPEVEPTEQGIFDDQDAQTQGASPRPAKKVRAQQPTDHSLDQTEKLLEQKSQDERP